MVSLPDEHSGGMPLWFVTVVLAGAPVDHAKLRAALERFTHEHAFATSMRYAADRIELTYWDEARSLQDAAEAALHAWWESRAALGLNGWTVVGLEVLDQTTLRDRTKRGRAPELLIPGEIRPL